MDKTPNSSLSLQDIKNDSGLKPIPWGGEPTGELRTLDWNTHTDEPKPEVIRLGGSQTANTTAAPASIDEFVKSVTPAAQRVAQRLNVPVEAVIGQWGLETGWGKSVISGTNNLGNIKDFSGGGVAATDNQTGSRDKYRQYDSTDKFAEDFTNLIGGNSRYQGAKGASDAATYFQGLKAGGYAEDPEYVNKGTKAAAMAAEVLKRTSAPQQQQAKPDLSKAPKWSDIEAKPEFKGLSDADKANAKAAYFDYWIAPSAGAQATQLRQQFLNAKANEPGILSQAWDGLKSIGGAAVDAVTPVKSVVTANMPQAPDLPTTSRVPVRPEVRAEFNRQWDAANPEQRDQLAKQDGWIGMLARERAGIFERYDNNKNVAGVQLPTTADKFDTRSESRRARLAGEGEDLRYAERVSEDAARAGIYPGKENDWVNSRTGTIGKTDFDFDTQALFDPNGSSNGLNNPIVRGLAKGGIGVGKAITGMAQFEAEVLGLDGVASSAKDAGKWLSGKERAIGERGDFLSRNFEGAINSIAQQLPMIFGGVKTGSEVIPLAGMAVQSFGQEYHDGRAAGQTIGQAATRASIFAAFEVIGEKFGLGEQMQAIKAAARGMPSDQIVGFLWSALKKEVPGELLTTTGQFATDKYAPGGVGLNPNATGADYLKQVADTIAQTMMQSGVMAAGTTGASKAYSLYNTPERQIAREIERNANGVQWSSSPQQIATNMLRTDQFGIDPRNTVRQAGDVGPSAPIAGSNAPSEVSVTPDGRIDPTQEGDQPVVPPNDGGGNSGGGGMGAPAVHPTVQAADDIVRQLAEQAGMPLDTVLPILGTPEHDDPEQRLVDLQLRLSNGEQLTPQEQAEYTALQNTIHQEDNQDVQNNGQGTSNGLAPSTGAVEQTGQPSGTTPIQEPAEQTASTQGGASIGGRNPEQQDTPVQVQGEVDPPEVAIGKKLREFVASVSNKRQIEQGSGQQGNASITPQLPPLEAQSGTQADQAVETQAQQQETPTVVDEPVKPRTEKEAKEQKSAEADAMLGVMSRFMRGGLHARVRKSDDGYGLYIDGKLILTTPTEPKTADAALEAMGRRYAELMRAADRVVPSNPEDMTRDQFVVFNQLTPGGIVSSFEETILPGQPGSAAVINPDGTFGVDQDKLYDRIQQQKAERNAKPAPVDKPVTLTNEGNNTPLIENGSKPKTEKEAREQRKKNQTEAQIPAQSPADEGTAQPSYTRRLFRGSGRKDKGSVYNGGNTPILGNATYYALDEKTASKYGPDIESRDVSLRNPLIIDSDQKWRKLTREAGWDFPNPQGKTQADTERAVDTLQKMLRSRGHDGVVIDFDPAEKYDEMPDGRGIKTLRNVFGDPQVIVFDRTPTLINEATPEQASPATNTPPTTGNTKPKTEKEAREQRRQTEIITPEGEKIAAVWDVVDADSIQATLKEGKNQPRDRTRFASNAQVAEIANNPDFARLSDTSKTMDHGAPTLTKDGVIVGGNGRFEGVSQSYGGQGGNAYRQELLNNATRLGLDAEAIKGMGKPVLVRRLVEDADTRKLAIQSNQAAGLQMSDMEQAAVDAERMKGLDRVEISDNGEIPLTRRNMDNIKAALSDYTTNEMAGMLSADGGLSQSGVRRLRNAILYKAYGKSDALSRLIESPDADMKNVGIALVRAGGRLATVRDEMNGGAIPAEYDIAQDLNDAIGTLSGLREAGTKLEDFLAQNDMFGDVLSDEAKTIIRFLNDNLRSAKNITEFLQAYAQQVLSVGKASNGLFGETQLPSKQEALTNATEKFRREQAAAGAQQSIFDQPTDQTGQTDRQQPEDQASTAQGDATGQEVDGDKSNLPSDLNALDLTPKQYHEAKLRKISAENNIPISEVREFYDTDAGRAENQREWLQKVVQAAKNGSILSRQTLDKFFEIAPNANLPEGAIPVGYQKPEARKSEAEEKQARIQNRKNAKNEAEAKAQKQEQTTTNQALSMDDLGAMFDEILAEEVEASKPKAKPKTEKEARAQRQQAATPPTATQAATSAVKNTAAGLSAAIDGLGELFGQKPKNDGTINLNSGIPITINRETYEKAKPLFKQAIANLGAAGKDLRAAMQAVVRMVMEKFGAEATANMKPYVLQFIMDVQNGVINLENSTNDTTTGTTAEQNSANGNAQASGNKTTVPNDTGATGQLSGQAIQGAGQSGARGGNSSGVSGTGAAVAGEQGNLGVRGKDGRLNATSDTAGDSEQTGSGEGSGSGTDVNQGATRGTVAVASLEDRIKAQKAAESIKVVHANAQNIAATLPLLMPSQHEDVLFAEKRLTKPNGYGVLFTNGTGTGKTFLGLGIVKRMAKDGKTQGLIVVPNDAVMNEWTRSAERIGLKIKPLEDTNDAGSGIAITTYANLANNRALADRGYDFVVADEAHNLMSNAAAEVTSGLMALRAITLHPDGLHDRVYNMIEREATDRMAEISAKMEHNSIIINADDTMWEMRQDRIEENKRLEAEWGKLNDKRKATMKVERQRVESSQNEKRPRAVFLSATPFAYPKNTDWANGYLFEYEPYPTDRQPQYNEAVHRNKFMVEHFGYRMKHNKLNEPDANVDSDLMQRQFNTWMRKQGVLSARMLDVEKDYDRKFVLIDGGVGTQIDQALRWLREAEGGKYAMFFRAANDEFDYLSRVRLLEAIKAQAAVPYIKEQHALGRKVVVFYDFNTGGGFDPFPFLKRDRSTIIKTTIYKDGQYEDVEYPLSELIDGFTRTFPTLNGESFAKAMSPLDTLTKAFPNAAVYNGVVNKKTRQQGIDNFNNDNQPEANLLIVQAAANAGWSGHDTTGKFQRVLVNLGLPVAPAKAIQQEGRIYRVGQMSDAIFRYFNTGTLWEQAAFANAVARRASAVENMAMGEQARGLLQSFIDAFNDSAEYQPSKDEGTGGKKADRALASAISDFDRGKTYYFAQQKKTSSTKAQEGADYFATPEPIGVKMVEWLHSKPNDRLLEPSAGHGAIARWFPENTKRTVIEPSLVLSTKLALITDAKQVNTEFEAHDIINKYDGIVMNPPFGVGGKLAVEHLAKAYKHLADGGRIVAIIPEGPAADKRFDSWINGTDEKGRSLLPDAHLVASIGLPTVTFNRAGTAVKARIVIIDKNSDKNFMPGKRELDLSSAASVKELFDQIEDVDFTRTRASIPEAAQPTKAGNTKPTDGESKKIEEGGQVSINGKDYTIEKYITKAGKTKLGVWMDSKAEASKFSLYTFSPSSHKGKWFVDAHYLTPQRGVQVLNNLATSPSTHFGATPKAVRTDALARLKRLEAKRDAGTITEAEYRLGVQELIGKIEQRNAAQVDRRLEAGRRRGADWIIAALRRGVADERISREAAYFTEWLLNQNPDIANSLGISISDKDGGGLSGQYNPIAQIVKLFTVGAQTDTAVHEILHHTERMMPTEVQSGIVAEWRRAFDAAYKKATPEVKKALDNMLAASLGDNKAHKQMAEDFKDGVLNYDDHYQLHSPSEYWAVNGTRILSNRYNAKGSWVKQAIQWMKEFVERIKGVLGLRSDAPIIKALNLIISGDAQFDKHNKLLNENNYSTKIDRLESIAQPPNNGQRPNGVGTPAQQTGGYTNPASMQQQPLPNVAAPGAQATQQPAQPVPGAPIANTQQQPMNAPGGQNQSAWDAPVPTKIDRVIYELQDRQIYLKRVQEAIKQATAIPEQFDTYQREELYHGRVATRTNQFLERELRPLLTDMKLKGITLDELEAYLWARHAPERNAQIAKINPKYPDKGSGLTNAEVAQYLSGADVIDAKGKVVIKGLKAADRQRLDALAARIDAINAGTKQVLIQYGLETSTTIAAWEAVYKNYVPLFRDEMEDVTPIGQGFSVKGSASQRAFGSDRRVVDIIAHLALAREAAITRGEKNRVGLSLLGLAKANPNADFWTVDKVQMKQTIDKRTGLVVSVPDPTYKNQPHVLVVRIAGKDRAVVFNKRDGSAARTVEVLKNLDVRQFGELIEAANTVTRWLASVNTQYNPVFGLKNAIRDVQGAAFNLSSTKLAGKQSAVLKNVLPAMRAIWKIERHGTSNSAWDQAYQDMQMSGGTTGYREIFRTGKDRAKSLQKEIDALDRSNPRKVLDYIFNWLDHFNTAIENGTRLAAYKVAIDEGMTRDTAASIGKNLTINFNRKGKLGREAGMIYAFFNAAVQGTTRTYETLTGPAGRKIMMGGVALGIVQALILAAAGFEDDDPPQFERERNLIIPTGNGTYVKIPMALGLNALPNIGRIITEIGLNGGRGATDKVLSLLRVLADSVNPLGNSTLLQSVTPTLADPIAALSENKDFSGKPIAKENVNPFKEKPGFKLGREGSSWLSTKLAQGVNAISGGTDYTPGKWSPTPDQIDYIFGTLTGGVGREFNKLYQSAELMTKGEDVPEYRKPLAGQFFGITEEDVTVRTRFYNNLKSIGALEGEIVGRAKDGKDINGVMKSNPEAGLIFVADHQKQAIDKLHAQRLMVENAKMNDEAQRTKLLQAIDKATIERMRQFNQAVKEARQRAQ